MPRKPRRMAGYNAEGDFLYGFLAREPYTVVRNFDHGGRLIYVGCTRTKDLRKRLGRMKLWEGKHTKPYHHALERGKRPPKWITRFDWIEAILLVEEEYPSRQQAEAAEVRYICQVGFLKWKLSTPGLGKFGPHPGTRKYIQNPQAPGKREDEVYV